MQQQYNIFIQGRTNAPRSLYYQKSSRSQKNLEKSQSKSALQDSKSKSRSPRLRDGFQAMYEAIKERKQTFTRFSFKTVDQESSGMRQLIRDIVPNRGTMNVTDLWSNKTQQTYLQQQRLVSAKRTLRRLGEMGNLEKYKKPKYNRIKQRNDEVKTLTALAEQNLKLYLQTRSSEKLKDEIRNKFRVNRTARNTMRQKLSPDRDTTLSILNASTDMINGTFNRIRDQINQNCKTAVAHVNDESVSPKEKIKTIVKDLSDLIDLKSKKNKSPLVFSRLLDRHLKQKTKS